jgi:hypothetical protein
MKKLLFVCLILAASFKVCAQINKGQWLVGGNANWTTSFNSSNTGNATAVNIMPDAGYFFYNKLAGGLKLNYTIGNPSGNGFSFDEYGVSPFLRYYILPSSKNINIFGQVAYGWNRVDAQGMGGASAISHEWSISAGPAFFLNPHIALEFALFYTNTGGASYTTGNGESIGLNVGFQIHLGK